MDSPGRHQSTPPNTATRHLCAGAYLDGLFTRRVLNEYRSGLPRATAPSYGVDTALVVEHCRRAHRIHLVRDATLCLLVVVWALLDPAAAAAVCWVLVTVFVFRFLRDRPRRSRTVIGRMLARMAPLVRTAFTVYFGLFAALVVVQVLEGLITEVLGLSLAAVRGPLSVLSGLTPEEWVRGQSDASWLNLLALLWLVVLTHLLAMRLLLVNWVPGGRGQQAVPVPASRLAEPEPASNVTVYSERMFVPFVGAGDHHQTWSFALEVLPAGSTDGEQGPPRLSFTIPQLNQRVAQRLRALGNPALPPSERLDGLTVEDRIFAAGHLLRGNRSLLPDPGQSPVDWLPAEQVRTIMERPVGTVRHCLVVQVTSWSGEVVVSVFLHFATDGQMLYLESNLFALPPILPGYQVVDLLPSRIGVLDLLGVARNALWTFASRAVEAPLALLSLGLRGLNRLRWALVRARIRQTPGFDYGATASVRELAASADFDNYFQKLDAEKHLKIIERRVLQAVLEFLEEQGVDTTEYRRQQTEIINAGVVITGSTIKDSNFAVGDRARAGTRKTQDRG